MFHQLFARHMGTAVMQDFLVGMAQVVALEINLFDPDCMVLGGGLLFLLEQQRRGRPGKVHHRIPGAEIAMVDLIPHAPRRMAGQGQNSDGKP